MNSFARASFVLVVALFCFAARADVTVRGHVFDESGKPVAGARVSTYPLAMNNILYQAFGESLQTLTDADGRFEVRLPYTDVRYALLGEKFGNENFWHSFVATDGQSFELRMASVGKFHSIEGRLFDADDHAVANLPIELLGELDFAAKTTTAADGSFVFDRVPESIGQDILLAEHDRFVLPQFIVRQQKTSLGHLKLVKSATVRGTTIDAATGAIVPNVSVNIRAWFMSGFSRTVQSDAQGRWRFDNLPPGSFILIGDSPDHFGVVASNPSRDIKEIEVVAGATADVHFKLDHKATLAGVVVDRDGRGVADALVGARLGRHPQFNERHHFVRTDAAGRFAIATGDFDNDELEAFDPRQGAAELRLAVVHPGERRDDLRLQLSGATRITGIVTDEKGKPVESVSVAAPWMQSLQVQTDRDGKFDFGRTPLPGDAKAPRTLHVKPTRPPTVNVMFAKDAAPVDSTDVTRRAFYENLDVPFSAPASPDERINLHIVLKPSDLIVFSGRVIDQTGKAPAEAFVNVFAGNADATWDAIAAPNWASDTIRSSRSVQLSRIACEADGTFRAYAVRADGEAVDGGTRYSLGFVVAGKARKLVSDVIVPANKREVATPEVTLDAAPLPSRATARNARK